MSNFVAHESCPNCGSRNNLGVWDDGHKWCFGCGFYVPASKWSEIMQLQSDYKKDKRKGSHGVVDLPSDYTINLPDIALKWLEQYGLTRKEIARNGIGYSDAGVFLRNSDVRIAPLLILPIWNGGVGGTGCALWQGRVLGEGREKTKYYTRGLGGDFLPIYHSSSSNGVVVVCEDIISGIKISRVVDSMPLLGSFLSKENALRLSRLYSHLTFWLDYDKAKEAVNQAKQLAPLFDSVEIVITEKDPKAYSTEEIKKWLKLPEHLPQ